MQYKCLFTRDQALHKRSVLLVLAHGEAGHLSLGYRLRPALLEASFDILQLLHLLLQEGDLLVSALGRAPAPAVDSRLGAELAAGVRGFFRVHFLKLGF